MKRARILAGAALLATALHAPAGATYPGRNGRVAFAGSMVDTSEGCSYGAPAIFTMAPDGTKVRKLTDESSSQPAWSPKGNRLAYVRYPTDDSETSELRVMRADGSQDEAITTGSYLGDPTWSDHAFWIAFAVSSEFDQDILRVRSDGSRTEEVVGTDASEDMPSYSPDGERIAYVTDRGAQAYDIWTIRPDGTKPKQLTRGITRSTGPGDAYGGFSRLGWSPDGRWIIFTMNKGEGDSFIYKIRRNGDGLDRLARGNDAAWSPDGDTILFQARTGEHGTYKGCTEELIKMDPNGSNKRELRKRDDVQMLFFDWQAG